MIFSSKILDHPRLVGLAARGALTPDEASATMVDCRDCGAPVALAITESGLCPACYDDAGDENEHNDCHAEAAPGCRFCVATVRP